MALFARVPGLLSCQRAGILGAVRAYSISGVGADVPIKEILGKRGGQVVSVKPLDSAATAAKIMADANVGSAIVKDGDTVHGIVTERDFLRKVVARSVDSSTLVVRDFCTTEVIAVEESATVGNCMSVMNQRGMRHLPIVREGKVVDVISIRDLIDAVHDSQESELTYLRDFVGNQWTKSLTEPHSSRYS